MSDLLPQTRPMNAPPWAFWFESNHLWGWVASEADWRALSHEFPDRSPLEANVGPKLGQHSAFGFRSEYCGKRTLRDHAIKHGLTWMVPDAH